eukprot:gnl/MRDRNA2_/MRDRNA2_61939_c0_seq1.p1 gnl/MRDRNA2_/MRDRNA2_61939_c0~~gnl/MRDRNA2_/MRDRNA2_61939_c0_seq1.p1  ORF type:complete len:231 (+),score=62.24 gnl/MRDRNA2_/MRDRNA2_61939_c0_seq1:41-694(+)
MAVEALAQIMDKGDKHALKILKRCLDDPDCMVVALAEVGLLCNVKKLEEQRIAEARVSARLADLTPSSGYFVSLRAMCSFPFKLKEHTINPVIVCMNSPGVSPQVKINAGTLLARAAKYNKHAYAALKAALEHTDRDTRWAAVQSLAEALEEGNKHAINCVIACLHDVDLEVKLVALGMLGKCVSKGNEQARAVVTSYLKDAEKPMRVAAKKALSLI